MDPWIILPASLITGISLGLAVGIHSVHLRTLRFAHRTAADCQLAYYTAVTLARKHNDLVYLKAFRNPKQQWTISPDNTVIPEPPDEEDSDTVSP